MTFEELVKAISQEVLRQLRGEAAQPQVLLLSSRDCTKLPAVLQLLGPTANVAYWDAAAPPVMAERLILPWLSCQQMADLATGRASGPIMGKVLDCLLAGRQVEVYEFEFLRYRTSAPKALYQLYETYQQTLCEFGLRSMNVSATARTAPLKTLVTERDVIDAHRHGQTLLQIEKKTQLTPLARDCARERGIKFQISERS